MPRVPHIQPNESTGDRPPAGRADVSAAAWCAVGWQASANHNRLFHSALNTPSPLRACPAPAGGGLGRGFSGGIEEQLTQNKPETNRFFYHPDHLGSSSFITDADGEGYQHLQYLPFGETAVSQKLSWWSTPYQFTGKEKDDETGYNYFGARYYNSDVSVWLSVNPLSDKYPSLSPYMYCAGNPVMLVDPDGRNHRPPDEFVYNAKSGEYTKISDLGGCEVDFIHHIGGSHNGKTEILNKKTGENAFMKTSRYLRGYTRRGNITWRNIYNEWKNGTGPEKSLIYGEKHVMNKELLQSYQVNAAYEKFMEEGGRKKTYFEGRFGLLGLFRSNANMTEQMVGKAGVSIYPVGNLLVIMIVDSKSKSSWTWKWWDGDEANIPRINGIGPPKSTTHQTYLIIISREEMQQINNIYNFNHETIN